MVIKLTVRKGTSVTCVILARGAAVEPTSAQRHRAGFWAVCGLDFHNRLVSDTMLNVIEAFLLGGYY
jgi:ribulose bisphosphate carboxylase small subunit